jgi:hypothetical protein
MGAVPADAEAGDAVHPSMLAEIQLSGRVRGPAGKRLACETI